MSSYVFVMIPPERQFASNDSMSQAYLLKCNIIIIYHMRFSNLFKKITKKNHKKKIFILIITLFIFVIHFIGFVFVRHAFFLRERKKERMRE